MAWCSAHSGVEATGTCARCATSICAECTLGTLRGLMCPACGAAQLGRRKLVTGLKIGGVATVLVGGTVFGLFAISKGNASTDSAAKPAVEMDPYIESLRNQRDKAPCDAAATRKLVQELNQMKRHPEAIADAELFWSKCGEFDHLKWDVIHAMHQLGRNADAVPHETDLIHGKPFDSDFWWWRGEDRVKTDHHGLALADYRQSFANSDTRRGSRFAAARIIAAATVAGRPCEAVAALDYYVAVHEGDLARSLEQEVRALDLASECAATRGRGTTDLPRLGKVTVTIGGAEGTFLVEETCGTTAVTAAFAKRAQLAPIQGPTLDTVAAGAVRNGPAATATVAIGAATAPATELVIVDALPDGLDGVVGLSVLWKFELIRRDGDQGLTLEGSAP